MVITFCSHICFLVDEGMLLLFAFIFKHFSNYLMCAGLSLLVLSGNIPQRQVRTSLSIPGIVSLIAALMRMEPSV